MLCVAGSAGKCLRRAEIGQQRFRRFTDEDAEAQDRARHGFFEIRNRRQRRRQLRLCARRIELRASTRVEPRKRDAQGFALVVGVASCDFEPLLRAAQLEVLARDFRGDAHLGVVDRGFGRLHFRRACFDAAPHASEKVELPERIEACFVEFLLGIDARNLRLAFAGARIDMRSVARHRRREVQPGFAAQCARLAQPGDRHANVVVRRECALHEIVQLRIVEGFPELALDIRR